MDANVASSGKVIDLNSDEKVIKTPRRLAMFDGVLLRDLKLDKEVGGPWSPHLLAHLPDSSPQLPLTKPAMSSNGALVLPKTPALPR